MPDAVKVGVAMLAMEYVVCAVRWKKSSVPAASAPTGADIAWVATEVTETPADTVSVPRVVTTTAQMAAQLTAFGEIWNVLAAALHAYVGAAARPAASAGHPAPEIESALPLSEKNSRVPGASRPMPVAVKVFAEIPETGYVTAPTTQKPAAHFEAAGAATLVPAGQKKPAGHAPLHVAPPKPPTVRALPKKPAAHGVHAVAGATENVPALQGEHVGDVR